jgi:hypothetical protein
MSVLRAIFRAFTGDPGDPTLVDHVPVTDVPEWRQKKLDAARQKVSRPLALDVKVSRVTPPSHHLEHINARTEQARKVTHINTRRKP